MKSKLLLTAMTIAVHTSVSNQTVHVTTYLAAYHTDCRHSSVGNIQSNCNKRTCLQSLNATVFSAIFLFSELCQAVQVHERYRDPQWLYRHGFDITEFTAFQNYTHRQRLKLQLDWDLCLTLKLTVEPDLVCEIRVHLIQLTLLSIWEDSILLYVGWQQRGYRKWRGER
jgi:hypothetical protein